MTNDMDREHNDLYGEYDYLADKLEGWAKRRYQDSKLSTRETRAEIRRELLESNSVSSIKKMSVGRSEVDHIVDHAIGKMRRELEKDVRQITRAEKKFTSGTLSDVDESKLAVGIAEKTREIQTLSEALDLVIFWRDARGRFTKEPTASKPVEFYRDKHGRFKKMEKK